MSDVMLFGVLRQPIEMAFADELSRKQFHARAQEACDRIEALERLLRDVRPYVEKACPFLFGQINAALKEET